MKGKYDNFPNGQKEILETIKKNDWKLVIQSLVQGRVIAFKDVLSMIKRGDTIKQIEDYSELQIRAENDLKRIGIKEKKGGKNE